MFTRILSHTIILSILSLSAQSQEAQSNAVMENQTLKSKIDNRPTYELGFQSTQYLYGEPKMSEEAQLNGVVASLNVHKFVERLPVVLEFEYLTGSGKYNGRTWGGTPLKTDTDNRISTYRALFFKNIEISESSVWSLSGGFGYRFLVNKDSGPGSYKREIEYKYMPFGVAYTQSVTQEFSITGGYEYNVFLGGIVKSHFSDIDPQARDTINKQNSAQGYRASLSFNWNMKDAILKVQPYYQIWKVKDSDFAELEEGLWVYEPENETRITGVSASWIF